MGHVLINKLINRNAQSDFGSLIPEMTFDEVVKFLGNDYVDVGSGVPLICYTYVKGFQIYVTMSHDFLTSGEWKIETMELTRNGTTIKRIFFAAGSPSVFEMPCCNG